MKGGVIVSITVSPASNRIFWIGNNLQLLREEMEVRFVSLEKKIESVKGELTWRTIALFAILGTIMTLVDIFVD